MSRVKGAAENLMSALMSTSSSFSGQAQGLINSALNVLNAVPYYQPQVPRFSDPQRGNPETERSPQPPVLEVQQYQIPNDPPLEQIPRIGVQWLGQRSGGLSLPDRAWRGDVLREEYNTEEFDGDLSAPITVPDFSLLGAEPDAPSLRIPTEFDADPLTGTPPELPALGVVPEFDGDFMVRYEEFLDPLRTPFKDFYDALHDALDLTPLPDQKLMEQLQGLMRETAWSVPETVWHELHVRIAAAPVRRERHQALRTLEAEPALATGLPYGARVDAALNVLTESRRLRVEGVTKTDDALSAHEMEALQLALTTADVWMRLAFGIMAQQIVWASRARQQVVDAADGALDALLQAVDLKERELALRVRYNDGQLRWREIALERETTKLDVLRIQIASEQLKSSHNQNQLRAYQTAYGIVEQRSRKYRLEIDYALALLRMETLNLEVLRAEVQQYSTNLSLFRLQQQRDQAKLREEVARLDATIDAQQEFLIDLRRISAGKRMDAANIANDADRMRLDAAIYNAKIGGLVEEFTAISKTSDIATKAILAGSRAEGLDVEVKVMQQEVEDARVLQEQINALDDEKLRQVYELRKHQLNVARVKASADVSMQSSATAGGVAAHAYAGLNGTVSSLLREFA
jgi:hypothetical protein